MLRHGEPFFARHGPKAVFLARWVLGVRLAAAWLAGVNRMPWRTFGFWNALGGMTWAASVGLLAYLLGPTAEHLFKTVGVVGVLVAVVLVLAYTFWRRARARPADPVQTICEPSA